MESFFSVKKNSRTCLFIIFVHIHTCIETYVEDGKKEETDDGRRSLEMLSIVMCINNIAQCMIMCLLVNSTLNKTFHLLLFLNKK